MQSTRLAQDPHGVPSARARAWPLAFSFAPVSIVEVTFANFLFDGTYPGCGSLSSPSQPGRDPKGAAPNGIAGCGAHPFALSTQAVENTGHGYCCAQPERKRYCARP